MSLVLIGIAAAAATHNVSINHHGAPIEATYSARVDYRSKTVGAKTPNRMDMQRCRWSADIQIDRKLNDHAPALTRTIGDERRLSGSEAGACVRGDTGERRIAQHEDAIRAHLMAAAEADRAPLLAELDAVRNLAAN